MDNPIKVKDEPVEEKSPGLLQGEENENPVREGQGDYSIRDTMKKKGTYPLPSEEDKKFKQQDEFDEGLNKDNKTGR